MDPDSKVHGANMGPTWVLSVPDGPHVGPWTLLSGDSCEHMLPTDQYGYGLTQGSLPPVIALLWCLYDRIRSHKIWHILVYENTKCKKIIQSKTLFWNCDFMQFIWSWISVTLIHYPWIRNTPFHEAVFGLLIQRWWFIYQKLCDWWFK